MNKISLKGRFPLILLFLSTIGFGLLIISITYFLNNATLSPDDSSAYISCAPTTKVVLYGDSITAEHGYKYGNLLQQKLGSNFSVVTSGFPAQGSFPLRNLQEEVYKYDPDIVLLWWGMNEGGDQTQHASVYRQMVSQFKARGIASALLTTVPVCHKDYNPPSCPGYGYGSIDAKDIAANADKIASIDRSLAQELSIPLYDINHVINTDIDNKYAGCCQPFFNVGDGIHINDKGHTLMADIVSAGIKKDICGFSQTTTPAPTTITPGSAECGSNPRVRFETGDITNWVSGSQLNVSVPLTDLHINCFTDLNGSLSLIPNGQVEIKGTSGTQSFPRSDPRDITIQNAGSYTVTCKSSGTKCAEDSLTVKSSGGTSTPTPTGSVTPTVGPNNCPAGTTIRFEQGDITNWQTAAELKLKLPVENLHINCFTNNGSALLDGGDIRVVGPDYTFNVEAPEARNITTMTEAGEYTAQCKYEGSVCAREKFTLGGNLTPGCGPLDNNNDAKIDLKDFSAFAKVYKKASCGAIGTAEPPACGFKDNNTDGKLDIKDFANFARKYNTTCTSQ